MKMGEERQRRNTGRQGRSKRREREVEGWVGRVEEGEIGRGERRLLLLLLFSLLRLLDSTELLVGDFYH